ncbi:MAG: hypothetical protein HND44_07885 [Chloroflexi bacterium]|nr:hypothetical protein [Ardenticatenaceae bacterium]MBL1128407.1 hypothetical protein [Chloroflexota bacterium]NOG34484.1 hypothetical protein [Chloroflexota bacterium]GIK59010.1 MAG: hypothetical protein BroJett015_46730 [Chloroflexota bacterium]
MKERHPLTPPPLHLLIFLLVTAVAACRPTPTPTPTPLPPPPTSLAAVVSTAVPSPYPPAVTPTPEPYNAPTGTAVTPIVPITPTPPHLLTPTPPTPPAAYPGQVYLPIITDPAQPTVTSLPAPLLTPTPTPTPSPTPIPTLDFAAIRNELRAQGQEMATVKIGFHVSVGGNAAGLEEWMRRLDEAGVPFFLKSVDNAQPILFAQELKRASGVPHVLVYRKTSGGDYDWDVPNYALPPDQAATLHWQMHRDAFPPELDPSLVWIETINEIDKNQAEWLGQFALKTAELALQDGFNWAAFGWASGEPEPEHWQTPSMLQFLRLAGQNPDRLAIALHEYSYLVDDIGDAYPYKVGRFQELFRIADARGIPRPTVLITEWGWTHEHVPPPEQAMADIAWASRLYAPYPEVKGAAIWYLGSGFADIANEAQPLIYPVMVYALQNYFPAPLLPNRQPIAPEQFSP